LTLRPFRGCWVWNGARTNLVNQGIDFQFKYTNEIAYNATGGIRSEATYADQYTAGVTLDLDRPFGVHDAQFQATVTERTLDTALIMAADTISGYVQGLLDGIEFKQTAYALDRDSRKAALARFLKRVSGGDSEEGEEERRLAA